MIILCDWIKNGLIDLTSDQLASAEDSSFLFVALCIGHGCSLRLGSLAPGLSRRKILCENMEGEAGLSPTRCSEFGGGHVPKAVNEFIGEVLGMSGGAQDTMTSPLSEPKGYRDGRAREGML